jgi:hypothetical protein
MTLREDRGSAFWLWDFGRFDHHTTDGFVSSSSEPGPESVESTMACYSLIDNE